MLDYSYAKLPLKSIVNSFSLYYNVILKSNTKNQIIQLICLSSKYLVNLDIKLSVILLSNATKRLG